MPERLRLTKNAQFYRVDKKVDDNLLSLILNSASDNMNSGSKFVLNEFRKERKVDDSNLSFIYSVRVFPSSRPVYFMDDSFEDTIYAFILIIEIHNYVAVIKKSCANISDLLEDNFKLVGSKEFSASLSDDEIELQRLALRNMTISERAMRSRAYEAVDLKGLLSTHSAGRSIPYYYKIRKGAKIISVSGTGRIVETSSRETINNIASWVYEQIILIEAPSNRNFLDTFASKVDLSEVLSICSPNAILIESSSLYERLNKDNLQIQYKGKESNLIKLSKRVSQKLWFGLEQVYEIDSDLKVIGINDCSRIRVNKKSITLDSKLLTKFYLSENGKMITLQSYIVRHGFYSITFDNPQYMYFKGSCFKDNSGVSEIDNLLEIFQPITVMQSITSEKGNFTDQSKDFEVNSMFASIEQQHAQDDFIFCDDLGDEWADHITFNKTNSNICFIHSKHGVLSTSASNLHDVVGQGIKNLGNMYFDANLMLKKLENKFKKNYNSRKGINTQIPRIRKGNADEFELYLDDFLKDYKLNRSCVLSCSFISLSSVKKEFSKIKAGESVNGHIIQLLWIISSFAHAAKDMYIRPIIYCAD